MWVLNVGLSSHRAVIGVNKLAGKVLLGWVMSFWVWNFESGWVGKDFFVGLECGLKFPSGCRTVIGVN